MYARPGAVEILASGGERRRIEGLVGAVSAMVVVGKRLDVGDGAGVQILDWATGQRLGQFCVLRDGGYLWSTDQWLAASPGVLTGVDVYHVDGEGREHAPSREEREQYLSNRDDWEQIQVQLYPNLDPARTAEVACARALPGKRRLPALLLPYLERALR